MKKTFSGHFSQNEHNQKKLWDECLFVLDANILLNLYRYSDSTRIEVMRILESLKKRLWLPHRAAEEYLANRLLVIDQQEKAYEDTVKTIESLKNDLENSRQHPFVKKNTMKKVVDVFVLLRSELEENKNTYSRRIHNDDIKDSIATLFESRIGSEYDKDKLVSLIKEGEERYRQKTPPGYKDGYKGDDPDLFQEQCRKYGDLIVWMQIIDRAKEINSGVVLITDDKKEDWWVRFKGKTIGPRPELVKEFELAVGKPFQMYQADRFLEFAREFFNQRVSQEILDEIREVRRRDGVVVNNRKNALDERRDFVSEYRQHTINRISMEMLRHEEQLRDVVARKAGMMNLISQAENEYLSRKTDVDKDMAREKFHRKNSLLLNEIEVMYLRENELNKRITELREELSLIANKDD
jgi:hypothetical protein